MAIDIKVSDGVDSSIATKLLSIANGADTAQKRVDDLIKRLNGLDASKLKAVNKAAIDASKVEYNNQRTAFYAAKEKLELAKLKTEQAKTAAADATRYHQFATNAQKLATQRSTDAEKVAQARLTTAERSARAATTNAEAMTKQAAANVKTQYQNQLLQYTGNWAKQDNTQRNTKTQTGQANLGVAQARQDEILARTLLTQQRLTTEVARGTKESNNAAVAGQRLTTETQRTAAAAASAATSQQRLAAATSAASAAASRTNTTLAANAARLSSIRSAGSSASGGIRELSSAMAQLDTSASFLRSDGLRWAKVMWALGGATMTAGAIVAAADSYTILQNRLSVVAESQASVNVLTDEMFSLAARTRQPVADVTKAFTRFDMALKEMGRSQKDTLVLTETVGKALQMSGATAGESASAMLQLSQAFNKGKLDGDEFRSTMENAPLIANALAKELGVTRGELLKLAPAGKLTVEQLTNAITNAAPMINELFSNFRYTIAQSFTHLRNEMTQFFGELDKSVGFTQALSTVILGLANNLDTLLFIVLAATPALALLVGTKLLAGFAMLGGYLARTSIAIGAIRSPITVVSVGLANMLRQGVATGTVLTGMFTTPTTRAIAFQLATVRATAAVLALGAAGARAGGMIVAAFSFGNIFLLIGTLVAAAIAFGDNIEMAGKKSYSMRDYVISAFAEVWDFAKFIFGSVYDYIAEMFGASSQEGLTFGQKVKQTFEGVVMFGAAMVDALLHVLKLLWTGVKLAVAAVADGIQALVVLAVNTVISFVNVAIRALNGLAAVANSVLAFTGADKMIGTFGEIGTLAGLEFKSNINAILGEGFDMKTGAMDAASTYLGNVDSRAKARHAKDAEEGKLRGYNAAQAAKHAKAAAGADKDKKEKKPKKSDAERRADIIEKAMNAEKKAIEVARQYGDERERVNLVESINNKLKEKGYAMLSTDEEKTLRNLVDMRLAAERVGKALQSMYEEVVNPQRDYEAGLKAVGILHNDGIITVERMVNMNERLKDSYEAATDKLYDMKKALQDQAVTQGKFGVEAAIAGNIKAAEDSAKSRGLSELTPAEIETVADMTRKLEHMKSAASAMQSVWEATIGTQETISHQIEAISQAYTEGTLSVASYSRQLYALMAQQMALDETMSGEMNFVSSMRQGLYQLASEMPTIGQGMADAISSTLGSAIDNISSTMTDMVLNFDAYAESVAEALNKPVSTLDVLRYALGDVINMIGKEMVNAVIKMGVQWAIQAALQRTMEATNSAMTIATQSATASAVNAVWTPAAISASIATLGGASATGMASFTAAQLAGQTLSKIPAFQDGGLISGMGNGRSDSILARVSNGEMVMNRDAVQSNYPMLNAMNKGQSAGGGYVDNSVHISIHVDSNGNTTTDEGQMRGMAKRIVSLVKVEVKREFAMMSKQGQALY